MGGTADGAAARKGGWWRGRTGRIRRIWKILFVLVLLCLALSRCTAVQGLIETTRSPALPFAETAPPPAPDYAQAQAWFALPGRDGIERSTPPGFAAIDEAAAPADIFFIHPTMYLRNDVWNAPFDVDGAYNAPVLLAQLSAFNGCCRLYAPHYRQSSLRGLRDAEPVALAYDDVARAFRHFIDHYNQGRPFIIASHSQGTGHAVRLLQEAVIGAELQDRLVAAYTIGAYAPASFAGIGLPVCASAAQTGCVLSWNAAQRGRDGAKVLTENVESWWQGARRMSDAPAICVNPLTWTADGAAAGAQANAGGLLFPAAPFPERAAPLPALVPNPTGAQCRDGLLEVDLPWTSGFRDSLAWLFGSYHRNDFGLFYANIRENAAERVAAWTAAHGAAQAGE